MSERPIRKRKRTPMSCTECRRRKKQCDRNVPRCSECVLRGVEHLCRWGDERDQADSSNSNSSSSSNSRLASSQASRRHDSGKSPTSRPTLASSPSSLVPAPSNRSVTHSSPSHTDSAATSNAPSYSISPNTINTPSSTEDEILAAMTTVDTARFLQDKANAAQIQPAFPYPTKEVAYELIDVFVNHVDAIAPTMPADEARQFFRDTYERHWDPELLRTADPRCQDGASLILLIFTAAVSFLPFTFSITRGLIRNHSDMQKLLESWIHDALSPINQYKMALEPTFQGVYTLIIFHLHLASGLASNTIVHTSDLLVRAARGLGLDRLGSAEDDERLWRQMDLEAAPLVNVQAYSSSAQWAADSFRRRDRKARAFARCLWYQCVFLDWARPSVLGSYMIHPGTYTTRAWDQSSNIVPQPLPSPDPLQVTQMLNQFIERACDFSRRHFDLCVDAQCQSRQIDFDAIMAMDAEIQSLLDQRPDWMRFEEKDSKELWSDTQSIEMVRARSYSSFIVATLWHRRFYIHRPFLTLSRLYPKTYGESASRCVHAAKQFVTVCQRGRERRLLVANANPSQFRLVQAGLVLITALVMSRVSSDAKAKVDLEAELELQECLQIIVVSLEKARTSLKKGFYAMSCYKFEELLTAVSRFKPKPKESSDTSKGPNYVPAPSGTDDSSHYSTSSPSDPMEWLDSELIRIGEENKWDNFQSDGIWDSLFRSLGVGG